MVGFRAFVLDRARGLGLSGWVRNGEDGSLQVRAEGPLADLRSLLAALHEGPSAARVDQVDASWGAATGEGRGFEVRP